jgi:signal transduction histidine kinase/DNA-binding response OmpR family regulator/sugar lactone lactonase YvrE
VLLNLIELNATERLIDNEILFQNISLKEGLSYSTVYDIMQDDQGYLWIGTGNGLNRYDGHGFVIFKNEQNDSSSIMNNTIWTIYQQNPDDIWLGTNIGLSCYNKRKNRFTNFPYQEGQKKLRITEILEWNDGSFILATNLGIYRFYPGKGYQKTHFLHKNSFLFRVDKNKILIGTFDGVFYYYPDTNIFERTDRKLKGINVAVILRCNSDQNLVWLGTEGHGLILYDLKDQIIKESIRKGNGPENITSDFVRSLCYDSQQRLWIGTLVGLNVFDEHGQDIKRFVKAGFNEGEISQNSIKTLLRDNQGGMWCGTYYGGLNYYHPLRNQFYHIYHTQKGNGLNNDIVGVIKEDSHGRIWIGTNEKGINIYDPDDGSFRYLKSEEKNEQSLPANDIKAIQEDANGIFWIGTRNGLCRYSSGKNSFEKIHISDNPARDNRVYALYKDTGSDILWVGSLKGLYLYNTKSKTISDFRINGETPLSEYEIISLFKDSKNGLWIGTNFGFFRYDMKSRQLNRQKGIRNDLSFVYCFYEDKDGNIWIGGNDGVRCYNLADEVLDTRFMEAGFPSQIVYGIEEDSFGNLWISTAAGGLVALNRQTHKWRIYTESDGIQSNQFSPYSHCRTRSGKMYFGGVNGINVFIPERIIENPYITEPIINRLTVLNKTVNPGDQTGILDQAIDRQTSISLAPKFNMFGLYFVSLNFLAGEKVQYAYKLDGFDPEWYQTETNNVSYSNLHPGKYLFRLRVINNDGRWSEKETSLAVIILPFWYETWWAKLLFVAFSVFLIFIILRFYFSRQLIANELEIERIDKERNKQMDQAKIRFFVNISHEFRTPLTLIISPVKDILDRGVKDRWLLKQLKLVERNAGRMLYLINQALDYRKTETGAMPLRVIHANVENFIRNHASLFNDIAKKKEIDYRFVSELNNSVCCFDPNFMDRILSNLIGNAFKYTAQKGKIIINLYPDDKFTVIEVSDNGCGIMPENQQRIFDRFYQEEENMLGTGIGLSLVKNLVEQHHGNITLKSEPGKGSVFTVKIPSDFDSYATDERHETDNACVGINNAENFDAADEEQYSDKVVSDDVLSSADRSGEKKTIMLVEDDEEIRSYLSEHLSLIYELIIAENGKEAWDMLMCQHIPDLIISDIMMPVMDGLTFCKMVKQNINLCHIPFIMLTAINEVEGQLKGLRYGADDYIGKPFLYSILKKKIENIFLHQQLVIRKYLSDPDPRSTGIVSNGLDEEFLQKAISIVEKNLDNNEFSVDAFGKELCMSRSNLHLKFKAITGEPAGDFIRKVRLSHAVRLLKEGRYSMSEISIMVGMTPAYFSTLFRKKIGCTPSEMIKKQP